MISRREYLTGAAATAGVLLAGCLGGSGGRADPDTPHVPTEPDYDGWFRGVSNYGRTSDLRGQSTVTIRVGSQGNMGAFGYSPAAVAVSPGTTVRWEWTGKGGTHDVVARDGEFASDLVSTAGNAFEHTLDEPGIVRYYCTPHRSLGMRGAVFVALGAPGS